MKTPNPTLASYIILCYYFAFLRLHNVVFVWVHTFYKAMDHKSDPFYCLKIKNAGRIKNTLCSLVMTLGNVNLRVRIVIYSKLTGSLRHQYHIPACTFILLVVMMCRCSYFQVLKYPRR